MVTVNTVLHYCATRDFTYNELQMNVYVNIIVIVIVIIVIIVIKCYAVNGPHNKLEQMWRVYGHHEYAAAAASINFTWVKFSMGEKIYGTPVVRVAQQRCVRSRTPALLRCWASLAIARQVRVGDRQYNILTNNYSKIISVWQARVVVQCVQKKHTLLFSCITLRKSNQFE